MNKEAAASRTANPESQDSQTGQAKPQMPLFGGQILLGQPGWNAEDFIESFAEDWGENLEVMPDDPDSPESSQIFAARLAGSHAVVYISETPCLFSPEQLEEAASENYTWPEAVETVRRTRSALFIAAGGHAPAEVLAKLFVHAAATLLDMQAAIGLCDCETVFEPVAYRRMALYAAKRSRLPAMNLFWAGICRRGEGFAGWTSGLARFGHPEIEVPQADIHPRDLAEFLGNICTYILEDGAVFRPGETIGYTEEQKLPIVKAESIFFPGNEVLQILFEPGEKLEGAEEDPV